MDVVVTVDGREAIPLRAIGFATGWLVDHHMVASGHEPIPVYLLEGRSSRPFKKANDDWRTYELLAPEASDGNRVRWMVDSLALIPAACFVWHDDLSAALCAPRLGDDDDDYPAIVTVNADDQGQAATQVVGWGGRIPRLNSSPFVSVEFEALVLESLEAISGKCKPDEKLSGGLESPALTHEPERKESAEQPVKRKALIANHLAIWPTIERDLRDGARNGLSASARCLRVGWWCPDKALEWARRTGKLTSGDAPNAANALPVFRHRISP